MGVEVTQDESITLGLEEWVEFGGEARWTRGGGRDVDVVDVDAVVVDDGCDGKVFCDDIVGEEGV